MVSIVDSLVAPLSLINALVVALCMKRPQEVKRNLAMLEDVWNNYQVYLHDEINVIGDEPLGQEEPETESAAAGVLRREGRP